jgi:hypothetical protein
MKLPDRYNKLRENWPSDEVSYGSGGIKLFGAGELENGQLGYSVAPDGSSLCSGENGAWRPNWVVIGYKTGLGDPLFVDTDLATLPVFTAMHGEGAWEPVLVAASVEAFGICIEEFARISEGRSNPVHPRGSRCGPRDIRTGLRSTCTLSSRRRNTRYWITCTKSSTGSASPGALYW